MASSQISDPATYLASTLHSVAALSFVPVAVHFNLFYHLVAVGPVATAQALADSYNASSSDGKPKSPLSVRLAEDTMYAMSSLRFVDYVDTDAGDTFRVNAVTQHIVNTPSVVHGMNHFTIDPYWSGAFLMRKLQASNFTEYPFQENQTPSQFGYAAVGEQEYANEHTYGIIAKQGRMESFNLFMEGKFGKFGSSMPARIKSFGYDLDGLLSGAEVNGIVMVDIGGGRGEQLIELHQAYPQLTSSQLVLQEYQVDLSLDETAPFSMNAWDYKSSDDQPIRGARAYNLSHIYHNLSDELALSLMKKVSNAMRPEYSRMLIQEFSRNANYGKMHAAMITLYAGRTRSRLQWKDMAAACGLKVTFEKYPDLGEGLIEMMKVK
ncbi:hypothetical protein H2198_006096 [Neophaeococcomyces mojaviensis]|uniref:Uncharacterized protein n=1 Tax=Neophaeococcomyces mojaviensis TaxID=3383035 RepID=A0ACC3A4E7_9EURO|nr:hypothetical protein H2198_006096 [Knufia sp. JES_112]